MTNIQKVTIHKSIKVLMQYNICLCIRLQLNKKRILLVLYTQYPLYLETSQYPNKIFHFVVLVNLPTDPKYFEEYESEGLENFYVQVRDGRPPIRLGVWHIFPRSNTSDNATEEVFDGNSFWRNDTSSNASTIIYFHGAGEARSYPFEMYKVLRSFFHVVAFDYRSKLFKKLIYLWFNELHA